MRASGAAALLLVLALAGSAHQTTHTLRPGEHLTGLARALGTTVEALAAENGLTDPDQVFAGQVLRIPGRQPAPAPAPPPPRTPFVAGGAGVVAYTVRPGDTVDRIARRHGTSAGEVARHNRLKNPNVIRIGARLEIPSKAWVCPVGGARRYVDDFGVPRSGGRQHQGVDIHAPRGAPVVASVGGTLIHAHGRVAGLAYYLHGDDGVVYYGAHLDHMARAAGRIAAGELIGTVGTSGNAMGTAPHLHFEVKPGGGAPVSPFATLQRWC